MKKVKMMVLCALLIISGSSMAGATTVRVVGNTSEVFNGVLSTDSDSWTVRFAQDKYYYESRRFKVETDGDYRIEVTYTNFFNEMNYEDNNSVLELLGPENNFIAIDDDGGENLWSRIDENLFAGDIYQFVIETYNPNVTGDWEVTIAHTPIPSAALLLASGIGGIVFVRRKRATL